MEEFGHLQNTESAMTMMQLKVTNSSVAQTNFAVFQKKPKVENAQCVYTLAWQCRFAAPGVSVTFLWEPGCNAVWCQPGRRLGIGVICESIQVDTKTTNCTADAISDVSFQVIDMDPGAYNTATLSYDSSNNAFFFGQVTNNAERNIYTCCDGSVPNASVAPPSAVVGVGIGMDGAGTFLVEAETNKRFVWQVPEKPEYLLTFGDYKRGMILDVDGMAASPLEIAFNGTQSRSVILTEENVLQFID